MITFYDLAAKHPIKTCSPNPWKTRFVLNFKNLPYKTIPVEMQDLADVLKEAGVPPSETKPDGSPSYTSPSIFDDATGTAVSDSYKIAEYLDKAYPDTPKAFPPGSEALQAAFYHQFGKDFILGALAPILIPEAIVVLKPAAAQYFRRTREAMFGKPWDQLKLAGEEKENAWNKVKDKFDSLNGWYSKSSGPYIMGETVSFADFTVGGMIQALKIIFGEDSKEWKDISTWNDGRWLTLFNDLDKYASTEN